jgi:hypothetical protein
MMSVAVMMKNYWKSLSRVDTTINLTPETKIVTSAALYFAKHRLLPRGYFLGYIRNHVKGKGEGARR